MQYILYNIKFKNCQKLVDYNQHIQQNRQDKYMLETVPINHTRSKIFNTISMFFRFIIFFPNFNDTTRYIFQYILSTPYFMPRRILRENDLDIYLVQY